MRKLDSSFLTPPTILRFWSPPPFEIFAFLEEVEGEKVKKERPFSCFLEVRNLE